MGARLAERYAYMASSRTRFVRDGRAIGARPRDASSGDLSELAAGETFDLVCAFEVLEHIEDDDAALTEWRARVRPGGRLLLSVPASERSLRSVGPTGSATTAGTTRSTCARCC